MQIGERDLEFSRQVAVVAGMMTGLCIQAGGTDDVLISAVAAIAGSMLAQEDDIEAALGVFMDAVRSNALESARNYRAMTGATLN